MESAIERIDATYSDDTPTYSIAIVSMSSLSVIFSEIGEPQPSTTTTIGFFTRDPIGFRGSPFDLYEFLESSSLQNVDPMGEDTWVCSGQMSNIKTFTLEEVDKDGCTLTSKITLRAQRCFRNGNIGSNVLTDFFAEIQFDTSITRSCPCQPSTSWKTYRYCRTPIGVFIKPTLADYGRSFDPKPLTKVDDFRDAFCPGAQVLTPGP